jgi:uncharacterized protein (DUF488 family)
MIEDSSATRRIFTIGHGARPVDELVSDLGTAGIRCLVDVRTAPGSRRHPQFGRDALSATLASNGIEYVWRKELGGFRKPRPDSRNTSIRNESFRGYADYMSSPEFLDALAWLESTSAGTPTAVMCAESLWWRCHRRMIADALLVRGWHVVHILPGGRTEPHRFHPDARVVDGRPVYDGGQADLGLTSA